MKIKHVDLVIDETNPFATCQLERKKYADVLTNLVETYADGFVLAINNEWGTGKSTFVKMWQQQLKNQGFKTLYFNAWENDFENKPLVALMSELSVLQEKGTEKIFKSLISKGAVITKNVLPQLLKAIASKYIDTDMALDAIENTAKGATEILKDEIKDYTSKKKGLKDFRDSLTEFVKETQSGKPIIFIIDELDRCRPNYAVELLEQIKHFFSVPGIVFVLSIDKVQLGHAVRGVYGSDRINADEYLKRFIDVEYSIPRPNTELFCTYLYYYFEFNQFLYSVTRRGFPIFANDGNTFIKTSTLLFDKANLTLRTQEKIFAHSRIALLQLKENSYVLPELFVMLAYIKMVNLEFYNKLKSKTLTIKNVIEEFNKICPKTTLEIERNEFIYIEAMLIFFYNNGLGNNERVRLSNHAGFEITKSNDPVISLIDKSPNQDNFVSFLTSLENNSYIKNIKIQYLLNTLDLVDDINI